MLEKERNTNPNEHLSGKISNSKVKKAGFEELQFNTGQINLNYVMGPNNGLKHLVDKIGNSANRDLADYFSGMERPVSEKRKKRLLEWFIRILSRQIRKFQSKYPQYGLVGAMDDKDAEHIIKLAPHIQYKRIPANHVIYAFKPKQYIEVVEEFAKSNSYIKSTRNI